MKTRTRFASNAVIYTISNFAVAGVPFLLMPLLTRALSPEAYGAVAMFTVVVSFFVAGVGLNLHGAVMVRYFNRENFSITIYVSSVMLILIFTSSVLAAAIFAAYSDLEQLTGLPHTWLQVALIVAVCQSIVQFLLTLWQSAQRPASFAAFRLCHASMDGLLSVLLVVTFALSWEGRLFGITAASTVAALVALWILFRSGWLSNSVSKIYIVDALRYGVPLVPHAIAGLLLALVDRFLVTNLLDLKATGIYMVGVQVGLVLQIAADAFNKAYAPWLMENLKHPDLARDSRIVKFTYGYFAFIFIVALGAGLFSEVIIVIIAGEQYKSAAEVVKYTLVGNAFVGMYYMVTNYIFYSRRTEMLSLLTMTIGSFTVVMSWYLIQESGIVGAAQAFMAGQILMFFCTWLLANHCHPMPWRLRST
jgi:O-antigen/teichoic acid export membrane protein